MTETEKKRNDLLAPQVINALKNRNHEAYYAQNKEEALKLALEIIPKGSKVGWGGVKSAEEIGLIDEIRNGDYIAWDRDTASSKEEKGRIERQILSDCDYFIMSANGMSEDGVIINIDGNSNRVAALCYGPQNVIMIVGMNKIAHTVEDAYRRAKYIAGPINAQRFGLDTPCAKLGKCMDCQHEQCICCNIVETRYSRHKGRIKVILVNENLGF